MSEATDLSDIVASLSLKANDFVVQNAALSVENTVLRKQTHDLSARVVELEAVVTKHKIREHELAESLRRISDTLTSAYVNRGAVLQTDNTIGAYGSMVSQASQFCKHDVPNLSNSSPKAPGPNPFATASPAEKETALKSTSTNSTLGQKTESKSAAPLLGLPPDSVAFSPPARDPSFTLGSAPHKRAAAVAENGVLNASDPAGEQKLVTIASSAHAVTTTRPQCMEATFGRQAGSISPPTTGGKVANSCSPSSQLVGDTFKFGSIEHVTAASAENIVDGEPKRTGTKENSPGLSPFDDRAKANSSTPTASQATETSKQTSTVPASFGDKAKGSSFAHKASEFSGAKEMGTSLPSFGDKTIFSAPPFEEGTNAGSALLLKPISTVTQAKQTQTSPYQLRVPQLDAQDDLGGNGDGSESTNSCVKCNCHGSGRTTDMSKVDTNVLQAKWQDNSCLFPPPTPLSRETFELQTAWPMQYTRASARDSASGCNSSLSPLPPPLSTTWKYCERWVENELYSSISQMPPFQLYSVEELRLHDYVAGVVGGLKDSAITG